MKTLEFILSANRLRDDLDIAEDRVIAFLDKWPEEYPPDIGKPYLEENETGDVCYELEWYQGNHDSVVLFIRNRAEPLLFVAHDGKYHHRNSPTNEQILEEIKKKPVVPGNLSRFWR